MNRLWIKPALIVLVFAVIQTWAWFQVGPLWGWANGICWIPCYLPAVFYVRVFLNVRESGMPVKWCIGFAFDLCMDANEAFLAHMEKTRKKE